MPYKDCIVMEDRIHCDCGCCTLEVTELEWEPDATNEVEFSFRTDYIGGKRNKLRALKDCLRNKETYYASCICSKADAIRFLETVLAKLKGDKTDEI